MTWLLLGALGGGQVLQTSSGLEPRRLYLGEREVGMTQLHLLGVILFATRLNRFDWGALPRWPYASEVGPQTARHRHRQVRCKPRCSLHPCCACGSAVTWRSYGRRQGSLGLLPGLPLRKGRAAASGEPSVALSRREGSNWA